MIFKPTQYKLEKDKFNQWYSSSVAKRIAKDLTLKEFVSHPGIDEMSNGQAFRVLGLLKKEVWKKSGKTDSKLILKSRAFHNFSNSYSLHPSRLSSLIITYRGYNECL